MIEAAKWIPMGDVIEINTVTSLKESMKQILEFPNVVWGASFMVSLIVGSHPTKMVEALYPLFQSKSNKQ